MKVVWLVSRAKEASGGEREEGFLARSNMICLKRSSSGHYCCERCEARGMEQNKKKQASKLFHLFICETKRQLISFYRANYNVLYIVQDFGAQNVT